MIKIGKAFTLICMLLFSVFSRAAEKLEVIAHVDTNQVEKGDSVTLTVSISSKESVSVKEPRLPDLKGFELIGTNMSTSSRSTFANGRFEVQVTKAFIYRLVPTQVGKLKISPIEVVVDGSVNKTKAINIKVGASGIAKKKNGRGQGYQKFPRPGQIPSAPLDELEDVFSQLLNRRPRPGYKSPPSEKESFFIQVEVDKTDVFVGEQVTASWYLYTRAQIRDIDTLKYPTLKGFWKEDIEVATSLRFKNEVINGMVYQKALLASYALFPIKKGVAVVDAYKAKCTVADLRGFGFGRTYVRTKGSRTVKINVKELPVDTQPSDFTGAVGKFQVSAKLDSDSVPANQPINLKIRVAGRGNAKLVDLPDLNLPSSVEIYDTKKESQFLKDGRSYKDFEILIIPREEGQLTVPPFSLSFFNPEEEKYYSRKTAGLKLTVLPGKDQGAIDSVPLAAGESDERKKDVLPPIALSWEAREPLGFRATMAIWGLAFLVVVIVLIWRGYVEFGFGRKQKNLEEILAKRLSLVEKKVDQGDWRGVGVELTNIVYFLLGHLTGTGGANLELEKMLKKLPPSVRREVGDSLAKTMKTLQILGFAPEGVVGSMKEKSELRVLVKDTGKLLRKAVKLASGMSSDS